MKNKILFLAHLPPPYHGSAKVGEIIQNSKIINNKFDANYIDISTETEFKKLGSFSFIKTFSSMITIIKIFTEYRKFRPDLVHFVLNPHGFAFYRDFLITEILKFLKAKSIIHMHSKGVDDATQNVIKKTLYVRAFKSSSVIHLDEILESDISSVLDETKRLYFVPNGIPDESKVDLGMVKKTKVRILFLSNLMPSKGAHILLQAINRLNTSLENSFELVIVGDSIDADYTSELKCLAEGRFRDNIKFPGPLYGEEKLKILRNSDIFVLPTKNDCFPLSILEAMSHSLAIISAHQGAIPNIVENRVNGYLMDGYSVEQLTGFIEKYIMDLKLLGNHQLSARQSYLESYTVGHFEEALLRTLNNELEAVA